MTIEPRVPPIPSGPSFPLNVQEGSPQYTLTSQITPTSSTTFIYVSNSDSIVPISNAYYTIQNEDGSKWCTFYVGLWTVNSTNNYTGTCTYSSSNTSDVFPEGSICWCIWCKEYYDSLITPISTINNEIDTLTPKVDNSFVSATKTNDTTLRLTRNDGTTVDISFPKGLNVRTITGENINNLSSAPNELIVVQSCILTSESDSLSTFVTIRKNELGALGYLKIDSSEVVIALNYNEIELKPKESTTVTGLIYNTAYIFSMVTT